MNIIKPQKKLFENLNQISDLVQVLKNTDELEKVHIENYQAEELEINEVKI